MARRPLAAWIAPPMLAAIAVPVALGLAGGSPVSSVAPPAGPSWASPATMVACTGGSAARTVTNDSQTARGSAWTLEPVLSSDGALNSWELTTTAPGVRAAALRLPVESAVSGPVDGLVTLTTDDGKASVVSLVSTQDGCSTVVHRDREVIRSAVLEHGSGALLIHAVRRSDRADLGIHRVQPGATPKQLVPPVSAGDAIEAAVGQIWTTRLVEAHGGGLLAVQSCGAVDCRTRLVDLASGLVRQLPSTSEGALVGLDRSAAILFRPCVGLPCPLVAVDAAGRERILTAEAVSATTTTVGGWLVVAAVVQESEGPAFYGFDPVDGSARRLPGRAAGLALLPAAGVAGAGLEAAAGWIAAADESTGRPFGLDLTALLAAPEMAR